jgi:hypothetical protein
VSDKRKQNKLKGGDKYRLYDWIRANWPAIQEEGPTQIQTAAKAAATLDLPYLNANHIGGIVRDLGLAWPSVKQENRRAADSRVDRFRTLAACVGRLFDMFEEPRPAELTRLIGGKALDDDAAAGPLFGDAAPKK